jgi:adenylylsulfate kinase-like enzyme
VTSASEVLLLAGRSGVGKSSVAMECHAALGAAEVRHCLIDGDTLDMAYPTPWEHGLAERNLTAM